MVRKPRFGRSGIVFQRSVGIACSSMRKIGRPVDVDDAMDTIIYASVDAQRAAHERIATGFRAWRPDVRQPAAMTATRSGSPPMEFAFHEPSDGCLVSASGGHNASSLRRWPMLATR